MCKLSGGGSMVLGHCIFLVLSVAVKIMLLVW